VEAAGIPTVAVGNLRRRMEMVNYPRAALVRFPRGATVGAPHMPDLQRQVLLDTLELLHTATRPGTLVELSHPWPRE